MEKLRLREIQDALATRLDEGGAVILTQAYVTPGHACVLAAGGGPSPSAR